MNEINGMECLECGKELIQIEGKRQKVFCNNTCRSNHWQKQKRKTKHNVVVENGFEDITKLEVGIVVPKIEQTIIEDEIQKLEKEIKDGKIMKFSSVLTQQLYFHERNKKIKELKQQLINQ